MAYFIKSKFFWATFIVVAVVVFLIGVNNDKKYSSETDILVLPKSEKASRDLDVITGNIREIALSLPFYERLLLSDKNIEDQARSFSEHNRKKEWNSQIRIERQEGSGVVKIIASDDSRLQASLISHQTAKNIARQMSRYYDIRKELEIRIIDGPIVGPKSGSFSFALVLWSLVLGVLAGMAAYLIDEEISGKRFEKRHFPEFKLAFPSFSTEKNPLDAKSEADHGDVKEKEETREEKPVKKAEPEREEPKKETEQAPRTAARKAAAPENLPIGSEFVMSSLKRAEKTQHEKMMKEREQEQQQASIPKTHEATEEEIRRRLNKLLGGRG